MFATLKQIFNRKNKDLQKKILFTFAALFVFKLGTAIIVPGIDKDALTGDLGFLELLNAMGGGALGQFSILALGVMPYISASLAIQVLAAADVVPYLSDLNKQGAVGKNKMNQITRVAGIIFAFIYGIVYCSSRLSLSGAMTDYVQYSLCLGTEETCCSFETEMFSYSCLKAFSCSTVQGLLYVYFSFNSRRYLNEPGLIVHATKNNVPSTLLLYALKTSPTLASKSFCFNICLDCSLMNG